MRRGLSEWTERVYVLFLPFALCLLLLATGNFSGLSESSMDLFFWLRGVREAGQQVVIVGIDEKSLAQLGPYPFPRKLHAELLKKLHLAKAVGFDILFQGERSGDVQFRKILGESPPVTLAVTENYEDELLVPQSLLDGRVRIGSIETITDADGTVRRVKLCQGIRTAFANSVTGLSCNSALEKKARWINFYGPAFSFLSLSYVDVLQGKIDEEFFRDRYVLIGAQAIALGDVHRTPLAGKFALPGVEIQANIIDNLLQDSFLRVPVWPQFMGCIPIFFMAILVWPAGREGRNISLSILFLAFVWGGCWIAFIHGLFLGPILPTLFLLLAYPLHLLFQWLGTTLRLVRAIALLDNHLQESLRTSYTSLPEPLKNIDQHVVAKGIRGGLRRHLRYLRQGIDLLSVQNRIINQLLSKETPPLALWERKSGRLILVNEKFRGLWAELDETEGTMPDFFSFSEYLAGKQIEEKSLELVSTGEVATGDEIKDIRSLRRGMRNYLRVVLHPVSGLSLGSPAVMASFTDVTGIRELERMRAEVMNIVSHELKLPLTTILGYAEMLSDSSEGKKKQYAEKILQQTSRLSAMIEGFLGITRIESGRYRINSFPFNVLDTIQDSVSGVSKSSEQKGVRIELRLPARVTPMLGDESLIVQVLLNLLDNAVKFSQVGGRVLLELVELEAVHRIRVSDQGPGIPEEERTLVFEKFVRGQDADRESKGFGLGLSFVKQVVESHSGTVTINSAPGGGCMVELILAKANPG